MNYPAQNNGGNYRQNNYRNNANNGGVSNAMWQQQQQQQHINGGDNNNNQKKFYNNNNNTNSRMPQPANGQSPNMPLGESNVNGNAFQNHAGIDSRFAIDLLLECLDSLFRYMFFSFNP